MRRDRGIVYVVYGEKARTEAAMSIRTMQQYHDLPVAVIGDQVEGVECIAFEQIDAGGRWAKINIDQLSPFDLTLYIDADTRVRGDLSRGFEILADGFDLAMTISTNQGDDLFWHVGETERQATFDELGYHPLQLQAGVMFVRKSERTARMFSAWRDEWLRWRDQDQAALLRALKKAPVKLWLLGCPYNGGELVAHLFGRIRERGG